MKALIFALTLGLSAAAQADNCVSADGLIIPNGKTVRMYYSSQPTKEIGPNYTCNSTFRTRTCIDGALSTSVITCSEYDSGGCVDWWMDRLQDTDFSFAQCND
ncbi:hypothetical protein ACNQKP_12295 [Bdellovibrio bacteriovorus]|uniref:hypothetical protein n=1 Tax=Bdellovibrio bacteriovorus TaxID=959 RepID=UPI003AA7C1C6